MDPRYIEHLTRFTEGVEEQPLVVHAIDLDEPVYPCTFCTHEGGVAERGIIDSDFELRTEDGNLVAYTCHACIGDAPRPAEEYDLEPRQSVIYDSAHNGKLDAEVVEVQKEYGRALIDIPTESRDVNVRIESLEVAD